MNLQILVYLSFFCTKLCMVMMNLAHSRRAHETLIVSCTTHIHTKYAHALNLTYAIEQIVYHPVIFYLPPACAVAGSFRRCFEVSLCTMHTTTWTTWSPFEDVDETGECEMELGSADSVAKEGDRGEEEKEAVSGNITYISRRILSDRPSRVRKNRNEHMVTASTSRLSVQRREKFSCVLKPSMLFQKEEFFHIMRARGTGKENSELDCFLVWFFSMHSSTLKNPFIILG